MHIGHSWEASIEKLFKSVPLLSSEQTNEK